jgi:hypothetical protein
MEGCTQSIEDDNRDRNGEDAIKSRITCSGGGVPVLQLLMRIIFMQHDLEKALNMELVLYIFEQISGLKINFRKSQLFYFGKAKDVEEGYKILLGCKSGSLPFRYL